MVILGPLLHSQVRGQSSPFLICLQQQQLGSKFSNLIKRWGGWDPPKENKSVLNQIFYLENVSQLRDLGPMSLLGSRILLLKVRGKYNNLDLTTDHPPDLLSSLQFLQRALTSMI